MASHMDIWMGIQLVHVLGIHLAVAIMVNS